MGNYVLGDLTVAAFLQQVWQKKAHLFKHAMPDFLGFLTPPEIKKLATHPDIEARLVIRHGNQYTCHYGPFRPIDFKQLDNKNWTLLIQSLNLHSLEADRLLHDFNFIPYARLDDIMVSYATPGGGVGPHFDHYDVFLLQGFGVRRWEIAQTNDLAIRPDQPLKLLQRFSAQQSWDLDPGDMLYLPPLWAHKGVAITECFTYSIGFRAPTHQEWVHAMLDYLRDELIVSGSYQDPNLAQQTHPAELSDALLDQIQGIVQKIQWGRGDIITMVGRFLSEPKAHVFFDPPLESMTTGEFAKRWENTAIRLDPRTQLLFYEHSYFINGDILKPSANCFPLLTELADERSLKPLQKSKQTKEVRELLCEWYHLGWLHFD